MELIGIKLSTKQQAMCAKSAMPDCLPRDRKLSAVENKVSIRTYAKQSGPRKMNGRLSTGQPRTVRESGFDPGRARREPVTATYPFDQNTVALSVSAVRSQGRGRKGTKGLVASPIWLDFRFEWHLGLVLDLLFESWIWKTKWG